MSKSIKAKAIIFDRYGVIINTEGVVIDSVRKAFKILGFTLSEEDIPQIIGRNATVYIEYFLNKWNFDVEEYTRLRREIFYNNIDSAPYFDEAINLIKNLYLEGVTMAVTTSAGKEGTLLILEKAGVDKMFKTIVTREDCTNLKPHPEPYLTTAEKLEIAPEYCVVLEDTALGVEAAKAAGMYCIAVPNEYTKDQDFSKADAVVQSAKEVESLVEFIK